VFVADDAFGSTEYRSDLADDWARDLDALLRVLDGRHWLLLTTRTAPLNEALRRMHVQGKAEGFPEPGEVQVAASGLAPVEKAMILYRHAKAEGLEDRAKALVRQHAATVTGEAYFTPERIRRFVSNGLGQLLTAGVPTSEAQVRAAILDQIRTPTPAMRRSLEALRPEQSQFLVGMLDVPRGYISESAAENAYARFRDGDSTGDAKQVADQLVGHFVPSRANPRWETHTTSGCTQAGAIWSSDTCLTLPRGGPASWGAAELTGSCSPSHMAAALPARGRCRCLWTAQTGRQPRLTHAV